MNWFKTENPARAEGLIALAREELAAVDALPAALLREAFGTTEDRLGDPEP